MSDTIRTGVIDPGIYEENPGELMLGELAALFGLFLNIIIILYIL